MVAHHTLMQDGHMVDFATPGGIKPTVDKVSLQAEADGQ